MKTTKNLKFQVQIFTVILCIFSCRNSKVEDLGIPTIDIENNINSFETVNLSTIAEEVEYIPLETNENCLVGEIRNLIVSEDRFFLVGLNFCRIFSRQGKFIGNAGSLGGGPGQYSSITSSSVDEKNKRIFLLANINKIFEYSFDGRFIRSIDLMDILDISDKVDLSDPTKGFIIADCLFFNDSIFCCTRQRLKGNEPYVAFFFDNRGKIIKSLANNYKHSKKNDGIILIFDDISITKGNEFTLFDQMSDTVFSLNKDLERIPTFSFRFGKYKRPVEAFEDIKINSGSYLKASQIIETKSNVFFRCSFGNNFPTSEQTISSTLQVNGSYLELNRRVAYGYYNKETRMLLFLRNINGKSGFQNDIDGGMTFVPENQVYGREMVYALSSADLKEWIASDQFKYADPISNEKKKALEKLSNSIDDIDNPVLMIITLKE